MRLRAVSCCCPHSRLVLADPPALHLGHRNWVRCEMFTPPTALYSSCSAFCIADSHSLSSPFNQMSIQIPRWIKESIREGKVINQCVLLGLRMSASVLLTLLSSSAARRTTGGTSTCVGTASTRLRAPPHRSLSPRSQIRNLVTAYLTLLVNLEPATLLLSTSSPRPVDTAGET